MKKYIESVNKHLEAQKLDSYDLEKVANTGELREALANGHTVRGLLETVEVRYSSITGILTKNLFGHVSKSYVAGMRKGFKLLFIHLNIE